MVTHHRDCMSAAGIHFAGCVLQTSSHLRTPVRGGTSYRSSRRETNSVVDITATWYARRWLLRIPNYNSKQSCLLPVMYTVAPASPNWRAMPFPTPLDAPVTKQIFPVRAIATILCELCVKHLEHRIIVLWNRSCQSSHHVRIRSNDTIMSQLYNTVL